MQVNNIVTSKQTYNPYHLSSYKPDVITERSEIDKPSPKRLKIYETNPLDSKKVYQ
jgi:hypothetical protein